MNELEKAIAHFKEDKTPFREDECPIYWGYKDSEDCILKTGGKIDNWWCLKCVVKREEVNEEGKQ